MRQVKLFIAILSFCLVVYFGSQIELPHSSPPPVAQLPNPTPVYIPPTPEPTPYKPYFRVENLGNDQYLYWLERGIEQDTGLVIKYGLEVRTGPEEHYRCRVSVKLKKSESGQSNNDFIVKGIGMSVPGMEGVVTWNNPELQQYLWPKSSYSLVLGPSQDFCGKIVKIIVKGG